jgi:hypothetical protein
MKIKSDVRKECYRCKRPLRFHEMIDANPEESIEYLRRVWENEEVKLYCCTCRSIGMEVNKECFIETLSRPAIPIGDHIRVAIASHDLDESEEIIIRKLLAQLSLSDKDIRDIYTFFLSEGDRQINLILDEENYHIYDSEEAANLAAYEKIIDRIKKEGLKLFALNWKDYIDTEKLDSWIENNLKSEKMKDSIKTLEKRYNLNEIEKILIENYLLNYKLIEDFASKRRRFLLSEDNQEIPLLRGYLAYKVE